MDITLANSAKVEIDKLLKESNYEYIRIITRCVTMHDDAKVDLIIDDIKEDDKLFEIDGYKIIINSIFAAQIASLVISYGGLMSRDQFSVYADFEY
ncbi:hypothetical protein [Romboutsia weinsteinii]|nr:hypothetical protein [Romboutsia weinsteinii]